MSIEFKLRRGTTAQHSTFTGAEGEVTVDTTKDTLVVHDGVTPGGKPVLSAVDGAVGTNNLADNAVTTAKVAAANITYAKIQNVSAGKVLGHDTSGSGVVQELPIGVDSSGNVGIGTSSPSSDSSLHIFSASDKARVSVQRSGVSKAWFGQDGSGTAYIYNEADNDTRFYNNSTERMRLTSAGLLQFNSGYGSVATAYGCRAWVNFNGTGTVAIKASGNVTSVTDNGTGDYTVNFTNAMPDTNYSACSFGVASGTNEAISGVLIGYRPTGLTTYIPSTKSTTQARIISGRGNAVGLYDVADMSFQVFR